MRRIVKKSLSLFLTIALLLNVGFHVVYALADAPEKGLSPESLLPDSGLVNLGENYEVDWTIPEQEGDLPGAPRPDVHLPETANILPVFKEDDKEPFVPQLIGIMPFDVLINGDWEYDSSNGTITKYNGTAVELTVPGSIGGVTITTIGDYAFQDSVVVNVTLPNSIRTVGYGAFQNCTSLRSVVLNPGLVTISGRAFYNCRALTEITIPDSVITLNNNNGAGTFRNCISLMTITMGTGLREIPNETFYSCHSLTTVNIGNRINTIGDTSFYDCWSLDAIDLQNAPLTSIGVSAFENCSSLGSVTFPANMRTLGYNAFKNCIVLENVVLNTGLTTINAGALSNCISLTSITIPDSVTTIGGNYWDGTFRDCISLTSVTIGNNLREIPPYAFYGCSSLTVAKLGSRVNTISEYAFEGCKSLGSISFFGSPLTTIGTGSFKGCSSINAVVLPSSLRVIGEDAFRDCTVLERVTLNEGLTTINHGAFRGCSSLITITIPNSVTTIGNDTSWNGAFYECTNLTTVTIGNGLRQIPSYAFCGCYSLSTLNMGTNVNTVGDHAFYGCKSLISADLSKIISLGSVAFGDCTGLVSVTFGNSLNTIESSAFTNCISLCSVAFGSGLRNINSGAFSNCISLGIIDLSKTPTVIITSGAFQGCKGEGKIIGISSPVQSYGSAPIIPQIPPHNDPVDNSSTDSPKLIASTHDSVPDAPDAPAVLKPASSDDYEYELIWWENDNARITKYIGTDDDITVPDSIDGHIVASIGSYAFQGTYVTHVALPGTVRTIEYGAFRECAGLADITLSEGLTTIQSSAFYGCLSLAEVVIPNSVTRIESGSGNYSVFGNCISLENVSIGNGLREMPPYAFAGCLSLTAVNMGARVNLISDYAFANCQSLSLVDFTSSSLTEIGRGAFENCGSISNIALPGSMKIIGDYAFRGCRGLETIALNAGLTIVGYEAFSGCISISELTVPNSVKSISAGTFNNCSSLEIATVGSGLRAIPDNAFNGCISLTEVYLSGNVKSIGSSAFYGCRSLSTVNFENSRITSIGNSAFENCTGIGGLTLPNSTKVVGSSAFKGCSALETIVLNEGLTTVSYESFRGCISLKSITIPGSVSTMGYNTFYNCASLETAMIGRGLREIPENAFSGCSSLSSITMGGKILRIGQYAFNNCRSLPSIDLSGVSNIGYNAFENCTGLERVILGNDLNKIENSAFSNCTSLRSVVFGTSLKTIGSSAFSGCTGIETIDLSRSPVIEIGNSAFNGCRSVNTVIIGKSVQTIGQYAFQGNTNLRNLTIGGSVVIIWYGAFAGCANLETVEIPESVQRIDTWAFGGCTRMFSASIPANSWIFGSSIFSNTADNFAIIGIPGSSAEEYADNNGHTFVPIGDYVTLDVDESTNRALIDVSGSAPVGKSVRIYDGNTLLGTFAVKNNRRYSGAVTLAGFGLRSIRAEITTEVGGTISTYRTVRYEENAPRLVEFIMYHDGQKIDLITTDGIRQTLIFRGGAPFTFEVKIENSSQINELNICSERLGENKYMRAVYDARNDIWLATGFFDPSNTNYVPGKLSIGYLVKYEPAPIDLNSSLTAEQIGFIRDNLNPEWKTAEIEVLSNSGQGQEIVITLADQNQTEMHVVTERQTSVVRTETQLFAEGYEKVATTGGKYIYVKAEIVRSLGRVLDFDEHGYASVRIYNAESGVYDVVTVAASVGLGQIPVVGDFAAAMFDGGALGYSEAKRYSDDYSTIRQNISSNTNLTPLQRSDALNKLDTIHAANRFTNVAIGIAGIALGVAFPGFWPALAIGIGGAAVGWLANLFFDYKYAGINNGAYRIAIDPSGYVYEAVPSNRLSGVKTTVYFKEDLTDLAPILWDASEYDQANPLYTDHEGRYAWDVPEGWWQVKYELAGYETAYSDWIPVPPPQTEVHMGMVSREASVVEYVNGYENAIEIKFNKYMEATDLITDNIIVAFNGNPVSGVIELVNSEWNPIDSRFYVSIIRFLPDEVLSGSVHVQIGSNVRSYANVSMSADYSAIIPIKLEPKQISAEDTVLGYNGSGFIVVTLAPADAAAGKTVIAYSDNPFIVTAGNAVVGGDGAVKIPINAELPGSAMITLTLEGTTKQTQVKVTVGLPELESCQITATAGEGGSVTGGGEQVVGALVTLAAIAQTGYVFEGWYDNGIKVEGAGAVYTFTATADRQLEARFAERSFLLGDVNGDGELDIGDVNLLYMYIRGKATLTGDALLAADVNGDGDIDIGDVNMLYMYIRGKIPSIG